jgi:ABC-2 type transport system permease protein
MMTNVFILACNDLAIAFKNKTFLLILFIPLFVFVTLNLVDQTGVEAPRINIGVVRQDALDPAITPSIEAAESLVQITWIADSEEGTRLLKERTLDGVLSRSGETPDGLALTVLKKDSINTLAILQTFSAVQKAAEGRGQDWITDVKSLHEGGIQRETLPTWILMLVLLIGFIILPAQVAEEKEKKLLLGLLQTPITEMQWLLAKLLLGMVLILTAVLFLHVLGRFGSIRFFDYVAILLAGSFCFSAFGVFLGFLCRNQASARTLGVVFYLPNLLPSAMADVSQQLNAVAPLLPSYQLFKPLQSILLEGTSLADLSFDWIYLLVLGSVLLCFSYLLMKRRWLM